MELKDVQDKKDAEETATLYTKVGKPYKEFIKKNKVNPRLLIEAAVDELKAKLAKAQAPK